MRARFVCQVNWYITRFKFYVQEQFLIWFGFFSFCSLKFKFATLLLALDVCHVSFRMKYIEWNPIDSQSIQEKMVIFCTILRYISCSFQSLCDFNAYLINNTSNVSPFWINIAGQHQPIIHVQLIGWCQMSYIPIAMHIQQPRKSITHRVLSIDLQFVKSDNIFVLFVARLHFSINQMMCWF